MQDITRENTRLRTSFASSDDFLSLKEEICEFFPRFLAHFSHGRGRQSDLFLELNTHHLRSCRDRIRGIAVGTLMKRRELKYVGWRRCTIAVKSKALRRRATQQSWGPWPGCLKPFRQEHHVEFGERIEGKSRKERRGEVLRPLFNRDSITGMRR